MSENKPSTDEAAPAEPTIAPVSPPPEPRPIPPMQTAFKSDFKSGTITND